jgi:uncharacterized membrane protein YcjF (UPF0283 family)
VSRPEWPEGTDPAQAAEFDQLVAHIQADLDAVNAELDAQIAAERAVAARVRRSWVCLVLSVVGLAICLIGVIWWDPLWYAGYTLVIAGMVYNVWDTALVRKLRARWRR